ncbi:AraC family transcriptional regulator [Nocardia blacklockiae]|uniref:AraC family transcriptional regulator n=1 Tax=Nocardia blacklockiae TaxID=480036 RepID=UPI0018930DF8|nr:AraC family transcriptional regulator [Nocardia blacklockiae]MBF6173017.1 AraC family transcriptional regulator [Nocardia blacklockiae]
MAVAEAATTRAVDPRERADYWAHLIDSYHCRLGYEFPCRTDFHGHTRLRRTAAYQLVGWESDAVTYRRDPKLIRADPDDDYRLVVPLAGRIGFDSADEKGTLAPGFAALVAIDRPFAMSMSDGGRGLIVTVPRREIRHRLHRVPVPARPLDLTTGLGRVAAGMIGSLYAESAALTDEAVDAVAERLVDLLCLQLLGAPASAPARLAEVEASARRYIHDHAMEPDLGVARVAGALGWSPRQLQLAFRATGTTPSEVIRETRLRVARDRLRNPAYGHRSIAAIAADLGFASISSFTKAFRRRFDITPGQLRHESGGHAAPVPLNRAAG